MFLKTIKHIKNINLQFLFFFLYESCKINKTKDKLSKKFINKNMFYLHMHFKYNEIRKKV